MTLMLLQVQVQVGLLLSMTRNSTAAHSRLFIYHIDVRFNHQLNNCEKSLTSDSFQRRAYAYRVIYHLLQSAICSCKLKCLMRPVVTIKIIWLQLWALPLN